jgi:hypothetical protein
VIPTIEQILADLMDGSITREKALAWIDAHLRLAEEAASESMRDGFAAAVMQGCLTQDAMANQMTFMDRAEWCYEQADAMLTARTAR